MVFVMVTDLKNPGSASRSTKSHSTRIVSKGVHPAIVRIGFLLQVVPDVMLSNEMTPQRVQAAGPKTGQDEIKQHAHPTRNEGSDSTIEGQLRSYTDEVPVGGFLRTYESRAKGVK